jgi:tetratricopeptide (TPR) repeat protein
MDSSELSKTVHQQELKPNSFAAHFNLGVDCRKRGDKQGAINAWTEALRIEPHNAHAYYDRGLTKAEVGDYNSALEDFNQAIAINPKYSNAYFQRDKVLQKLLDGSQTLPINSEKALICYQRGKVHLHFNEYKEAIKDFNEALQLNPHFAEAYYNRGKSRHQLKDQEGAIEDFQKAAQIFCDKNQVKKLAEWTPFELGESNKEEAILYLIQYLSWSSPYDQKRLAASGIQKLAKSFPNSCGLAIPHLLDNLSDLAPQVRQYALKALNLLNLPNSAVSKIRVIAEEDQKEYNRRIAQSLLNKMKTIENESYEDEEYEMNWVEYQDYLDCIEREPGLKSSQKIDLINGRKILFAGREVDYN